MYIYFGLQVTIQYYRSFITQIAPSSAIQRTLRSCVSRLVFFFFSTSLLSVTARFLRLSYIFSAQCWIQPLV